MLETFTTETFAPRVGETFRILPDGGAPVDATLVEVTPLGESATGASVSGRADGGGGRPQAFSLVFRAQPAVLLSQRIYRTEHGALGAFDLFLVPIGPDADGMRYEAVFT
jgi:hypothetical protein